MRNYRQWHLAIKEYRKDYKSVGVAQGGIESVMPKAKGTTSDVVFEEVVRQLEDSTVFAEIITDLKYMDDRVDRVKKHRDTLKLRLQGYTIRDIAEIEEVSRMKVNRNLVDVANQIVGTDLTFL